MKAFFESQPPLQPFKIQIKIPSSWAQKPMRQLLNSYANAYNKKHDQNIQTQDLQMTIPDNSPFTHTNTKLLRHTDTPEDALQDKVEIKVSLNQGQDQTTDAQKKHVCKNYGCQREFDPNDNPHGACRHHASPPVFHDTRKWWSCCEGQKVYSFEELMAIPGCVLGAHSETPPKQELERKAALKDATCKALAAHTEAAKPDKEGLAPPPVQNFTPSAAATAAPARKVTRPALPVGQARCLHYGCQQIYTVADNYERACQYHASAPLFHEGSKQWPCCGVKKWDFDEFIAVPGCKIGPHESE